MTDLQIIIKDLRKDMTPEENNELDGRKANFIKNLDAKYPGIYNAYLEMAKQESESGPEPETETEPETENIEEIIDEFLEFLDALLDDDEDDNCDDCNDCDEDDDCGNCDECDLCDSDNDNCDDCDECNSDDEDEEPELDFERIEFHDPATIVFWNDGTKTVVKTRHGDKFDKEKGLAMAIAKRVMGNTNKYYDVFEKYCFNEDDPEEKLDSDGEPISEVLEKFGIAPNETDAGDKEEFDLDIPKIETEAATENKVETETVANTDENEKSKKQSSKRGKK